MLGLILLTLAHVHAVEGHFTYKGQTDVFSATRHETVYTATPTGKTRLQELINEGYSCQPKLQFVQCSLSLENHMPIPLRPYSPSVTEVNFGALKSLTPLFQGSNLVQYEALQDIAVNAKTYSKAIYYEFKDFVKISVGSPDQGDYYSFVIANDTISYIEQNTETENQWVFTHYWMESQLSK